MMLMLSIGSSDHWRGTSHGDAGWLWCRYVDSSSRCTSLQWRQFCWARWFMQVALIGCVQGLFESDRSW